MSRAVYPQQNHPVVIKKQYDSHDVWGFEHDWHTKQFACKPMNRCCFSCFCAPCMGCKIAKYTGESMVVGCCIPCSLPYLRGKLRTARRIKGSCLDDCCSGLPCCLPCTQTQVANELEHEGLWDPPKVKKVRQPRNERSNQYHDYN